MDSLIFVYIALAVMAVLIGGVSLILGKQKKYDSLADIHCYKPRPLLERVLWFSLHFPSRFFLARSTRHLSDSNGQTLSEKVAKGKRWLGEAGVGS